MSHLEPVVLTGRFVQLVPLELCDVPRLAAAAAEDRGAYGWTPVPDGETDPPVRLLGKAMADDRRPCDAAIA